jgi:RNA polymerase-interacting CarD/CdnL/TRCF family regulator
MDFKIGDKVIHSTYGLGEITRIEDKYIDSALVSCYVFQTSGLQLWIPVDKIQQHDLRQPISIEEFTCLYAILSGTPEKLPEDHPQRIDALLSLLRNGDLPSTCQVVRDLTHYKRTHRLNQQERSILASAEKVLLTEWSSSQGLTINQAYRAMLQLLDAHSPSETSSNSAPSPTPAHSS